MDVGTISVIASATRAVISLVAPLLLNLIHDSVKWKREAKVAEAEKIDKATVDLLESLSPYRSSSTTFATGRSPEQNYSNLLSKYYRWERTIWKNCKNNEREQLKERRQSNEVGKSKDFHDTVSKFANEILAFAHTAGERV